MAIYSFEVRDGDSGQRIGRVFASAESENEAEAMANKWAQEEGYTITDRRGVREFGTPASEEPIWFSDERSS